MIHTITMNPALDISGTVDQIIPDEKSYVHDETVTPGGNGINAAIIARRLGADVVATGFLGGSNGQEIRLRLDALKIPHDFVQISGHTRMNVTVSNRLTHRQTRLSFPGPLIHKKEREKLVHQLSELTHKDLVVFGGSLPPGITGKFLKAMITKLRSTGIPVIVDVPGKALKEVVSAGPSFIKPNLTEFQELTGTRKSKIKDLLPIIRSLRLPLVCVSSVEGGAVMVSQDEAWFGRIGKLKINSTVGAGDSMVGAISFLLHKNPAVKIEDLLRLGLSGAAATLSEKGLTLGTKKTMARYESNIILKRL